MAITPVEVTSVVLAPVFAAGMAGLVFISPHPEPELHGSVTVYAIDPHELIGIPEACEQVVNPACEEYAVNRLSDLSAREDVLDGETLELIVTKLCRHQWAVTGTLDSPSCEQWQAIQQTR